MMKRLTYFLGLGFILLTACENKSTPVNSAPIKVAEKPYALRPPPSVQADTYSELSAVLPEELTWHWKIVKLDDWAGGEKVSTDHESIWFLGDEETVFTFKCNRMNIAAHLSADSIWQASGDHFGSTEAGCQGESGEQDRALLSVMFGPSKVERIGEGSNKLRFTSDNHEMVIERIWGDEAKKVLSHESLIGEWDVLRFDDYIPASRLYSDSRRSAFVDFYERDDTRQLYSGQHIGCNFSGNVVQLDEVSSRFQLVDIKDRLARATTQIGCPDDLQKRDEAFFSMFDESPKIERLGDTRLRFWTSAHELILEQARISRSRNALKDFSKLQGAWSILSVGKAGLSMSGQFYVPEPVVISADKIQYGALLPYLKSPRINGREIVGEQVGDSGVRNCETSRAFSLFNSADNQPPIATKENAICFVLDILMGQPVAEPIALTGDYLLSVDDYKLVLTPHKD